MNISLIGSIPEPIGGVTQHVWRLAHLLQAEGHRVAVHDLKPGRKKYPLGLASHHPISGTGISQATRLFLDLFSVKPDVIHIHASLPTMLPFLIKSLRILFPFTRLVLTLHHGNLKTPFLGLPTGRQKSLSRCLARLSAVMCLSKTQREFYLRTVGIPEERVFESSSYMPPPPIASENNREPTRFSKNTEHQEVWLISGQTSRLYQFEWAIRASDELIKTRPLRLIICMYGAILDQDYVNEIEALASTRRHVDIRINTSFFEFLSLQRETALYLRPTTTDSCGIALWDAAHLGCRLVASDVCERPKAALLHSPDSYTDFLEAIKLAVSTPRLVAAACPSELTGTVSSIKWAYGLT